MKKLLYIILSFALAISCSKQQEPSSKGFTLEVGVASSLPKTELGPRVEGGKYPVFWESGDRISVNGVISKPLTDVSSASTAEFTFDTTPSVSSVYNVLYPGTTQMDIMHFDGVKIPFYGNLLSLTGPVTLHTPSCIVRFPFIGTATLNSMTIKSIEGEKISGDFKIGKDGSGAMDGSLVPEASASDQFSVEFHGGLPLDDTGVYVQLVIPSGIYANGLKLVVTDNNANRMVLRLFQGGASLSPATVCIFPSVTYVPGSDVILTMTDCFESEGMVMDETGSTDDMSSSQHLLPISITAGSYNIWSPQARKTVMTEDPEVSEQRSWANSIGALKAMIEWLDCDVMGLQEVTNIALGYTNDYDGKKRSLIDYLPGYSFKYYPMNSTSSTVTSSNLGSTDAIIWKSDILQLKASGRYWIQGKRTTYGKADDGYGTNRSAIWAQFTHIASGKEFYFVTTHLDLPNAGGPEGDLEYAQRRNASELVNWMMPLISSSDIPSLFCGDMNCVSSASYDILCSGKWKDVYDTMLSDGILDFTERCYPGTMNADKRESGISSWRPDHIFLYGATASYYKVGREKFPTADGTMHYPSDHFPIKIIMSW